MYQTTKKFRDWDVYEALPKGWKIDKTCGSPLHGYDFCTNGKSIINGGKRALVKSVNYSGQSYQEPQKTKPMAVKKKTKVITEKQKASLKRGRKILAGKIEDEQLKLSGKTGISFIRSRFKNKFRILMKISLLVDTPELKRQKNNTQKEIKN